MPELVLASTSFRRHELLRLLGIPFTVVAPNFEEEQLQRKDFPSTSALVEALSFAKVMSIAHEHPEAIIVSGDTLVDLDGEAIGKPKDFNHAREILRKLSGTTHAIVSGVTVVDMNTNQQRTFSVKSKITFRELDTKDIEKYIQTGESLGKAGAYAFQGAANHFVKNSEGSITSIIGLPLEETAQVLEQFGVNIPVNVTAVMKSANLV
jgi:septum formation protein